MTDTDGFSITITFDKERFERERQLWEAQNQNYSFGLREDRETKHRYTVEDGTMVLREVLEGYDCYADPENRYSSYDSTPIWGLYRKDLNHLPLYQFPNAPNAYVVTLSDLYFYLERVIEVMYQWLEKKYYDGIRMIIVYAIKK